MSELGIYHGEFPGAIPETAMVGDTISFVVTGRIRGIEEDLLETSPLGGPRSFVTGERTTKIVLLNIERKTA